MKRRFIIRTLGMSLVILLAPFFIKNAMASQAASFIGFNNVNESISEARYVQFKIKAAENYHVSVRMEDDHGETVNITFRSQDDGDDKDYEVDEEVDYLFVYFPSSTITYESESFEDLIALFLSEDDDSTFDLTDDPEITRIQISGGQYFNFYSIALADNEDFGDPCWSKDAADWSNLDDFISDGGDTYKSDGGATLPFHIEFYDTYVHVTNTPSYSSPAYFPWGVGTTGWNQPYGYGWNQPSYGWNQPSFGWNQPSYGWNQPLHGWNQPSYGWNQPSYGWNQLSYGWNQPYNYGWNQPSYGWNQPYNYQQHWSEYPPYVAPYHYIFGYESPMEAFFEMFGNMQTSNIWAW